MKVVVVGAAGLLGRALCRRFGATDSVTPLTHEDLDVRDSARTMRLIGSLRPDVVINAAAYADVDGCESDPERAFAVNASGAGNVAAAARRAARRHVYVSTDYVFDGEKESPYVETDLPSPVNTYGSSKLAGEREVERCNQRSFIIRTSCLYGEGGPDFVHAILEAARAERNFTVVCDQTGSPTWVEDVARQLSRLVSSDGFGLYHATAEGGCTRYQLALEVLKQAGYEARDADGGMRVASLLRATRSFVVRPVPGERLARPARRPRCTILENRALKDRNKNAMPYWKDSLRMFISQQGRLDGRAS